MFWVVALIYLGVHMTYLGFLFKKAQIPSFTPRDCLSWSGLWSWNHFYKQYRRWFGNPSERDCSVRWASAIQHGPEASGRLLLRFRFGGLLPDTITELTVFRVVRMPVSRGLSKFLKTVFLNQDVIVPSLKNECRSVLFTSRCNQDKKIPNYFESCVPFKKQNSAP